jgi:2-haloalkanoic acid dehalogenase type II
MRLREFAVLSFDCYGTLIDWESGLFSALQPLLTRGGLSLSRDAVLEAFATHESRQQAATPAMLYRDLLAEVHAQLARSWQIAPDEAENAQFASSIGDWPPFPDTIDALRRLIRHFKLVILSNVDRDSFDATRTRLGVDFHAIYTAQDIGSYKPDPRNFIWLVERLDEQGIARDQILHVAQSLFHDHVPANAAGLASAWIDRRHASSGWGATAAPPNGVRYDFRFETLGGLADAVEAGQPLSSPSPARNVR